MSGQIRTNLGRDRRVGQKHCEEYVAALTTKPVPWDAATKGRYEAMLAKLQADLKKLEDGWKKWEGVVDRILDEDEHAKELKLYNEWRDDDQYLDIMDDLCGYNAEIQSYLQVPWDPLNAPVVSSDSDDSDEEMPPPLIPSLSIPKFDGKYTEWNTFWEMFELYVHKRKYPDVSKLAALRSLLQGRALEEIKGFTTSGTNYDTVVRTLTERFGNQQFVIRELELNLDRIQPAQPNATSIGSTVTAVTNMCRQLKNLGIDTNNNSMKNTVIKKMPFQQQQELQELLFDEPSTSIDVILDKMKKMEMKAELFASIAPPPRYAPPQSNKPSFDRSNSWRNTTQPFGSHMTCTFCDREHSSASCRTFTSPEQRIKQLRLKKRCINCMGQGHDANRCSRTDLRCKHCQQPHYAFLCEKGSYQVKSRAMICIIKNQSSLLTKKVNVTNVDSNVTVPATLFFDTGAQRSYVTNNLVKILDLPVVNQECLNVQGFGGKTFVYKSDLVKLRIQTVDGYKDIFANSAKKISDHLPAIRIDEVDRYYNSKEIPDILIGMDYFCQFVTTTKEIQPGLHAVDSIVGEMYAGKVPTRGCSTVSSLIVDTKMQNVSEECETFWKLETMGIIDRSKLDKEDELVQQSFESSVKFKDNRYYVSWPFKSNVDRLKSNAGLAIARLKSSAKKIAEDPEFAEEAQLMINDQQKRGTIELAPKPPQGKVVHYLAHHPVFTPKKTTTKVRMVYDGSAKASTDQLSLNDCLYRGPIDMPEIPGLLCRLRTAKILVTGDIEKAFHQIYLNEVDRDAVRFFWLKDFSKPVEPGNLVAYRFAGIPFGVITSPSMLYMTIKHHLEKKKIKKLLDLLENIFVDNIFVLEDDTEEALKMFNLIRDCFLEASMNVREWLSNDSNALKSIPEEIRQKSTVTKVLGLQWDTVADTLSIELKNKNATKKWTKRNVLKFIAAAYDPLGFLSPVTIKGRIFMQKLFLKNFKWDDALPPALVDERKRIQELWNGSIAFPRRLVQEKFPDAAGIEIHVFADASKYAYCAAAYLRIPASNGYQTPLVFAKTRLQPIKKNLTIPKMEVMGIWLAAKIGSYVAKEMKIDRCAKFIWTDSQISVCWFKKLPKETFVANRLKEVLESKAECLFVPGKMNPADLGTRGIKLDGLRQEKTWWNGPDFLKKPREEWPKVPDFCADVTQTVIALVSLSEQTETCNFSATIVDRAYPVDEDLSWDELKKKVACTVKQSDDVQAEDIQNAERALIIQEQETYIKPIDIKQLKLVKDDEGIYRTNYRFDHAELVNAQPIFIPKQSSIAKMICLDTHKKLQHAGTPHTLSKLREKYWIPSGRATVMKCINRCVDCKYWKYKPFSLPQMPQLPAARVVRSKPFQNVGIDYCGPFKVKEKAEKAWVILFTCFSTRLMHLEPVSTMTAEDFLVSFRKFVARRGVPRYILSDNAKQFKTAANALDEIWKKAIKDEKSIDYMLKNDISWDFITERAPWKGGLYERLVALVKNSLKICIGKKFINLNEFSALLCEIESTLNTRPITYVHGKESFVIRPSDFIYPSIDLNMPTTATDDEAIDPSYMPSNAAGGEVLAEKYIKSQQYVDRFWKLWAEDYLNLLRERNVREHKNVRGATQRDPIAGEYVLVSEADQPRGCWKIAKIIDVIQSADKEIRSCEIKYVDGFVTRRALNHVYPSEEGAVNLDISA